MNFKVLLAASALLASQSFAIIGVGVHYAPNFGTKMTGLGADREANKVKVTDDGMVQMWHGGFEETMHGLGVKLWIDFLPKIDVEATFNLQFGSYDASLFYLDPSVAIKGGEGTYKQVDLEVEMGGTPFGKANPKYVQMNGDISVTYPLTFIPIFRPYIGGGITYYMNTFILNQKFTKKVVGDTYATLLAESQAQLLQDPTALISDPSKATDISGRVEDKLVENIQDAAIDEGLNQSIGFHLLVGVRAKLPIIPIAAYANFKYYFLGDYPEEVDPGRMAAEVGVGFAL